MQLAADSFNNKTVSYKEAHLCARGIFLFIYCFDDYVHSSVFASTIFSVIISNGVNAKNNFFTNSKKIYVITVEFVYVVEWKYLI